MPATDIGSLTANGIAFGFLIYILPAKTQAIWRGYRRRADRLNKGKKNYMFQQMLIGSAERQEPELMALVCSASRPSNRRPINRCRRRLPAATAYQ